MLQRLSQVGTEPTLNAISNPKYNTNYEPVSMPMPSPIKAPKRQTSLWRAGSRAFFKDQRAQEIGDIVTVIVNINDSANLSNGTSSSRDESNNLAVPQLGGLQESLAGIFPNSVDPTNFLNTTAGLETDNKGQIERSEEVNIRVAAIVIQELPNGNLVLSGRQETRVNSEIRELALGGIIRPQDIDSNNTISADDIAELRLSYGGRGQLSDIQKPRYGTQIVDIILPF